MEKAITSYIDENGIEITIEKSSYDQYAFETRYEDKKPVYEKSFVDDKLERISHYVFSIEEKEILLTNSKNVCIIYVHNSNSYKVSEFQEYENGNLIDHGVTVFDSNDNIICFSRVKSKDHYTFTEKFYYEDGSERYTFVYNADGSFFSVIDEYDNSKEHCFFN